MTREEAARVLKYLWIERDENAKLMQQLTTRFFERQEALRMGAAALRSPTPDPITGLRSPTPDPITGLRSPTPDPITGLVPCGCGGKAVCEPYWFPERDDDEWHCFCNECGVMTMRTETSEGAREEWNTAMGWKGGAE